MAYRYYMKLPRPTPRRPLAITARRHSARHRSPLPRLLDTYHIRATLVSCRQLASIDALVSATRSISPLQVMMSPSLPFLHAITGLRHAWSPGARSSFILRSRRLIIERHAADSLPTPPRTFPKGVTPPKRRASIGRSISGAMHPETIDTHRAKAPSIS